MPKANPDVTLHIPQAHFQAVQTRLTDFLLRSQYAFAQSFSGRLDTTVDIFLDGSPAATHESLQLALYQATHGTSIVVTQHCTPDAVLQSAPMTSLLERLVAVCTANENT